MGLGTGVGRGRGREGEEELGEEGGGDLFPRAERIEPAEEAEEEEEVRRRMEEVGGLPGDEEGRELEFAGGETGGDKSGGEGTPELLEKREKREKREGRERVLRYMLKGRRARFACGTNL